MKPWMQWTEKQRAEARTKALKTARADFRRALEAAGMSYSDAITLDYLLVVDTSLEARSVVIEFVQRLDRLSPEEDVWSVTSRSETTDSTTRRT